MTSCDSRSLNAMQSKNKTIELAGLQVKTEEQSAHYFAQNLKINYQLLNNIPEDDCDKSLGDGHCFLAKFSLSLDKPITLKNWRIYFSFMSPIQKDLSQAFDIVHHNGDLHYLTPTQDFAGWDKVNSVDIKFKASFWQISEFDVPPNFYLVTDTGSPLIIASTKSVRNIETLQEELPFVSEFTEIEKQFKRTKNDASKWATAEKNYLNNEKNNSILNDVKTRIIPKPKRLILNPQNGLLNISKGLYLQQNDFEFKLNNPAISRLNKLGVTINQHQGVPLDIIKDNQIEGKESYHLAINLQKISIAASAKEGAFYGLQSIAALLTPKTKALPVLKINDQPRFSFRGFHLDVARNFRDKLFLLKLMEQMAAYKLNKLHLHLGDDEGWRLEIPGLPELTQVGAYRCHDLLEFNCLLPQLGSGPHSNTQNNGFYSLDDYQQILKQAKKLNIQVIPSFDMPGHSRAAVKSMQARFKKYQAEGKIEYAKEYLLSDPDDQSEYSSVQFYKDNTLNVCQASTYRFVEKIIDEVIKLHQLAGVPLKTYHIGADETAGAWKNSPVCKVFIQKNNIKLEELSDYFVRRVAALLEQRQIQVAGWSDGIAHIDAKNMPENVQVNAWAPLFWDGHKVAHATANKDWQVIVSSPDVTYFDFPYEADPKERGYYWGSRFTNTQQVFNFMPENLPLHAEIWTDRQNNPYVANDKHQPKSSTQTAYHPLKKGKSFKGLQGHLWGEMVRSDQLAEYMIFPRLLALAERAWHRPAWEPQYDHIGKVYSSSTHYFSEKNKLLRDKDWNEFANAVGKKALIKMDIENVRYRIPTVGAIVKHNQLLMNSAFPGLIMQFKLDNKNWQDYPLNSTGVLVKPQQKILVRAKAFNALRYGRALSVKN